MKIAVIGANGLLGSAICDELNERGIVHFPLEHKDFDIRNTRDYTFFSDNGIDMIINTAAYLGAEACEANPTEAFNINCVAVEELATFCKKNNIINLYISTDAVFDGKTGNYHEDALPNPLNMYALTKYNGEQMTKNLCDEYYICRIPILFGQRKNNGSIFIEKMHTLYKNGVKKLKIADDIICRPSYNKDIARGIVDIVLKRKPFGLYHLYNEGKASLYEFATEFFTQLGISDIVIEKAKAADFAKSEKALKPLDTTLISKKTFPLRNWKEAIQEYIREIKG